MSAFEFYYEGKFTQKNLILKSSVQVSLYELLTTFRKQIKLHLPSAKYSGF